MTMEKMSSRERFLSLMEYGSVDRVPNHEVGVWAQTAQRWKSEGLDTENYNWNINSFSISDTYIFW